MKNKIQVEPHPITFTDAVKKEAHGLDLDRIKSKKNAVFEALEKEKHSFARNRAIEFFMWATEREWYVFDKEKRYFQREHNGTVTLLSHSDLYSQFLDHQKKQQEGKGE